MSLSYAERRDWVRLIRSDNVGPITFAALLARYETASAAIDTLPELAARGGRKNAIRVCPMEKAEQELEAAEMIGARCIATCEADYPVLLSHIDAAPPIIYVLGNGNILNKPTIAIVGARNGSAAGKRLTTQIAQELGENGIIIASGLARGIDTAAHTASAETGTIAVLAGGIDVIYPPENDELYARIQTQGLIMSEMPPGLRPQGRHFPQRNRLISGLAVGVLVVEAAARSGSLITARLALEQDREVFAVPGSPLDPRAKGTNRLIRQGALLTENAGDIMEAITPFLARGLAESAMAPPKPSSAPLLPAGENAQSGLADRLLDLLSPTPMEIDELIRQSGGETPAVLTALLELELAGRLERHVGQRISLA